MPRAVKDPTRVAITEAHVVAVLESDELEIGLTAKGVARNARILANGWRTEPTINERDVEIVHGHLRALKAEGKAEPNGITKTDKGSGKPPQLWRLVRHG